MYWLGVESRMTRRLWTPELEGGEGGREGGREREGGNHGADNLL